MIRAVPLVLAVLVALAAPAVAGDDGSPADGPALFASGCASCHGAEGQGVTNPDGSVRGPSLERSGEASAFYYLSTGRMPLANHDAQPVRKPRVYDDEQLAALVEFVASLGDGPDRPRLDLGDADLVEGGELFRDNCQACHSASGSGGALSYGRAAPRLAPASPDEIGAAVRSGPGQMPVFGEEALTDEQVADVAAYVVYLRDPADPGGLPIGRTGPIPEGFVSWFVGVPLLLGLVAWIGTRAPVARRSNGA